MFMKLFTNLLLCLTLMRLIIEPKLSLKRGFFAKQTGKKKLFFQTCLELFIKKNFVNLQSYNLPLQQIKKYTSIYS